jgi:hypothetical protein
VPPARVTYPKVIGSLISMGQSGAIQTRSEAAQGRMWQEAWPALPAGSEDVQELLVTIENLFNTGATCTLTHYLLPGSGKAAHGSGLGSPKVNGGGQSGTSLMTYGWTASETGVMKAGDCFTVPGCDVLFRVTADAASDGSGLATVTIEPPIVSGSSPTNSGVLTIASATLTAVVLDYTDSAAAGPDEFIGGLSVTFREAP